MKNVFLGILTGILVIGLIVGLTFGSGMLNVIYTKTIGKEQINANREVFESTKTYVKGAADDLAKYKYELSQTKDEIARKAIIDLIIDRYADFDETKLSNENLRWFLQNVRNGNIK